VSVPQLRHIVVRTSRRRREISTREVLSRVAEMAESHGWQRSAQYIHTKFHLSPKEELEESSQHVNEWRETEIFGATQKEVPEIIYPTTSSAPEIITSSPDSGTMEVVGEMTVKALGSWPSDYALWTINAIHTGLDIPFWMAIAGTTFAIRTALLPISILTMKHAARMQKAKPEIDVLQNRMKQDQSDDPNKLAMYQSQMAAVLEKHKVKPFLIFLFPLCQLPIFTSMFFGLQRLGTHYPDATNGGMLWFTDLTVADPYYILPIATSSIFFLMVEYGSDGMSATQGNAGTAVNFRNVMRVMAIAMIPLTAHFPTSVFTYWFTANCFSVAQTQLLNKNDTIRKLLDLPPKPKVISTKRTDAVAELSDAFSTVQTKIQAILDRDKQSITQVDPSVFEKRKQENSWLARNQDRVQPVETFKQKPVDAVSSSSSISTSRPPMQSRHGRKKRKKK